MPQTTMRDRAVVLAERGFRVFKLQVGGKKPDNEGWQNAASSDPERVYSLWTEPLSSDSSHNNIGIATGKGLTVLDPDAKGGKRGLVSLATLELLWLETDTFTVETPTGGRHLYYKLPDGVEVPNSADDRIGQDIDVRGRGGFVVGPGSEIDGREYVVANPAPIADAQPELIRNAGRVIARDSAAPSIELDRPEAIERATAYLATAPESVEGDRGDDRAFRVAARVKDFGVSEPVCVELLADHWNERCSPAWEYEQLQIKVANAYAFGSSPIGVRSALADFEDVSDQIVEGRVAAPGEAKRPRIYWESFADSADGALADNGAHLIEDLLMPENMSVIYGNSYAGKTFIALDLSFHIAAGRPWNGREVEQGAVVYVASEGGPGVKKRLAALRQHYDVGNVPLAVVPCSVDLLNPGADVEALMKLVADVASKMGRVKLVVIDTLSRALAGGDENSSTDMGALVKHLDKIRLGVKAHVAVIHHSGKDAAKGARGHSLLRAATDTEIEIAENKITITKQRDGEMGDPMPFALRKVQLGRSPRGKLVESCVIEVGGSIEFNTELTPEEHALLDALAAAVDDEAAKKGIVSTEFEFGRAFIKAVLVDSRLSKPDVTMQAVGKRVKPLKEKGNLVRGRGSLWRLANETNET